MFINDGRIVLDAEMEALPLQFAELMTSGTSAETARRLSPVYEHEVFGKKVMLFEGVDRAALNGLGDVRTPAIADLFVAKVKGVAR
jgi:ABC-2 type transport system ATP-binding protein